MAKTILVIIISTTLKDTLTMVTKKCREMMSPTQWEQLINKKEVFLLSRLTVARDSKVWQLLGFRDASLEMTMKFQGHSHISLETSIRHQDLTSKDLMIPITTELTLIDMTIMILLIKMKIERYLSMEMAINAKIIAMVMQLHIIATTTDNKITTLPISSIWESLVVIKITTRHINSHLLLPTLMAMAGSETMSLITKIIKMLVAAVFVEMTIHKEDLKIATIELVHQLTIMTTIETGSTMTTIMMIQILLTRRELFRMKKSTSILMWEIELESDWHFVDV